MTPFVISLREAPRKRAICETRMRYDVLLNGEYWGEFYFNMHGYLGYLPLPDGTKLAPGETSISAIRSIIRRLNQEARVNIYQSTYCNKGHDLKTGRPVSHECRVLPVAALEAERKGDFSLAWQLMEQSKGEPCG